MTEFPTFAWNPAKMKTLILLSFFAIDTLPSTEQLFQSLTLHHQTTTKAALAQFDETEPPQWMNYIPSIGIGYTPQGEPRPTASFSLAQIITAKRNRQERERQRAAILANAEIELHQLQSQLSAMLQEYSQALLDLETRKQIFEIDKQIFELAKSQYENAEMSPTEFLPKWKAFLLQELEMEMKKTELIRIEQNISLFINW